MRVSYDGEGLLDNKADISFEEEIKIEQRIENGLDHCPPNGAKNPLPVKSKIASSHRAFVAALLSMTIISNAGMGIEAHAQQRSFINPSFEDGPLLPNDFVITNENNVLGWRSTNGDIELWEQGFQDRDAFDGLYLAELNPSAPVGLFQEVCLIQGELLDFTFRHSARNSNTNPQTAVLAVVSQDGLTTHQQLATNSVVPVSTQPNNQDDNPWILVNGTGTYTGPTGIQRIEFSSTNPGSTGNFLDDIQVNLQALAQFDTSSTSAPEDTTVQLPQIVVSGLLTSPTQIAVSVDPSSTATGGGVDYTQTAPFVTIPAGNYDPALASSRFDVPFTITTDAVIEPDETLVINFGAITDSAGNPVTSLNLGDLTCTGAPVLGQATHTIVNDDDASLAILKTATPQTNVPVGTTVTYTYTVANNGNSDINDVSVTDNQLGAGTLSAITLDSFTNQSGNSTDDGADNAVDVLGVGDAATFTAEYIVAAGDSGTSVSNTATANGSVPSGPVVSLDVTETITAIAPAPSIELVKSVSDVEDTNGNGLFGDVGDTVNFVFTAENTGNTALAGISVNDTGFSALTGTSTLTPTAAFDGDLAVGEGPLQVAEATYVLAPADIAAGSLSNTATVNSTAVATDANGQPDIGTPLTDAGGNALPPVADTSDTGSDPALDDTSGSTSGVTDPAGTDSDGTPGNDGDEPTLLVLPAILPEIVIEKTLVSLTQVFPLVYDVVYQIDLTNNGNVGLKDVQVTDDLSTTLAPGTIISTNVTATGFAGAGGANAAYNGSTVDELLEPNADLLLGASASLTLTARMDFTAGLPTQPNTAFVSSNEVPTPIPSNDPTVTPNDALDTNPTPNPLVDTDGDGTPDSLESASADRDGDGIVDSEDFDPTGYFYCEETSAILPGGFISVTGPVGTQTGVGTSNNITIVQDGSNGFYQFFVSAAGSYTLHVTYPTSGVPSVNRLPGPALDVTSLLPANPGVLGAGEVGSTGVLSDGSAAANPFHFEFNIQEGDPNVFNNNIPLQFCGVPQVSVDKDLIGVPVLAASGDGLLTFRITAESTGTTQVNDLILSDDLDSVLGAGNFTVTNTTLFAAPATLGATANAGFNGSSDQQLLTSGGVLQPGETVSVDIQVQVNSAVAGNFTNFGQAGGTSPLTNAPIPGVSDGTGFTLPVDTDRPLLQIEKTAARNVVRLGETLSYTLVVTNPDGLDVNGVDIADTLPPGLTFRPGSGQIDGVATEPFSSGRRLVFANQNIPANSSVTFTYNVAISAAATAFEFENRAWAEDPTTGSPVSNIGIAIVTRETEHVFDCGEIIGRVFDDENNNKHHDDGEKGLAGVRLATVRGELITTDKHGRFHVPCAAIPDADVGSNFILKLDERTLPTGYNIVTENPRVVRLTRGKLTKLNFGASLLRVVRINLNATAFNGAEPTHALEKAIPQIIATLNKEKSVLRLDYWEAGEGKKIGRERTRVLSRMIKKRWKRAGDYKLEIDTRVLAK